MLVKRTYSARDRQNRPPPPSPSSSLTPVSTPSPQKRKRPLDENSSLCNQTLPTLKRAKFHKTPCALSSVKSTKQKTLTQLHFCIDQNIFRTCSLCNLSYTKGAPDDETLHRAHCARVQRGIEWGREEEREAAKANVVEIERGVKLKDRKEGRIICFPANTTGKIGAKISTLLQTVNLALSAPALTPEAIQASKVYLFLLSDGTSSREKVAGCVIAQRISTAMAIASPSKTLPSDPKSLVTIDASSGLFCHPQPLPTHMGIPRLFVPSNYRRHGIASKVLSAAAETFIHGCPLDPRKGEIAFTQPTGAGNAVMRHWGGDAMRIYEE
ncbi:hypothetical protein BDQ12DRAFT_642011 [Crucibulum laeve]|uniref:ESCO1/2 acetyl-transferase-domain-containing protein n=1 Tax=Crucibulum laeve TaxID=68775 RepID=A0A5C3MIE1_9AGAR|nr:hypothetical protein BDQ12DRAFT_642011 [Crucibulum laeve]